MVLVTGDFVAKDDRLAEAIALSIEHVRRSRMENGCISHTAHRDVENPLRIVFVERWSDRAALATHFAVPASRAFVKAVTELSAVPPNMAIYEATQVSISGNAN